MDIKDLKQKMLAKLGEVTEATKDFAEKAADKTKDLAEKAADKAKISGRIAKLSMEVASEKESMKKTYIEIGKLYYDTHKDDPDGFFIQLCEEIAMAEKAIAEKEAEIADLKAGDDDSIEVEFEEVVAEEEAAAECCCCCGEEAILEECDCAEEAPAEECCCECAEEAPVEECCCECAEEAPVEETPAEDCPCCCGCTEEEKTEE